MAVLPPQPEVTGPKKKVLSKAFEDDSVEFSWKPVPGVKSYLVKIRSLSSKFQTEKEVESTRVKMNIPVGEKFSWQVFSQVSGVPDSELSAKIHHIVHIGGTPAPKVHAPTNEFVTSVEWDEVDQASKYRYLLYHKRGEKWKRLQKGTTKKQSLRVKRKLPGGDYKLQVLAKGKYRRKSQPGEALFYMASERGPAAVKRAKLKEAVERPSRFQATGSYIVTNLNYSAVNPERQTLSSFSALGGSGRFGLGYTPRGTRWGGVGFAELSGFAIGGQVFTYFTMEAHATWKRTFGAHVMKLTAGGFIRELPETLSSASDSSSLELEKVRFMGPAAGLRYAIPISNKLGFTFNHQLYYSLISLGTPNGQEVQGSLSFQLSLLGSYRIGRKLTALIGYAYKKDSISYNALSSEESNSSFAEAGDVNSIDLNGHYLNLMLEWAF